MKMESIRHHYVPQGYLRGFSSPMRGRQFVWVYDKRPGRRPACKSAKSIAWAPAYYSQEREDGTVDNDRLEQGLAVNIDTKASELIARLKLEGRNSVDMTEKDHELLAFFIGLSLTRVPSFRDGLRDMYSNVAQYMAEMLAPQIWEGPDSPPNMIATAKEWVTLDHMIESAGQIANSISGKTWHFLRPQDDVLFITSDNPVVWNGVAPAHPSSELLMTLTSRLAIVCSPRGTKLANPIVDASKSLVKTINARIAKAARNRIFASEESDGLDRLAKKYCGFEQRMSAF